MKAEPHPWTERGRRRRRVKAAEPVGEGHAALGDGVVARQREAADQPGKSRGDALDLPLSLGEQARVRRRIRPAGPVCVQVRFVPELDRGAVAVARGGRGDEAAPFRQMVGGGRADPAATRLACPARRAEEHRQRRHPLPSLRLDQLVHGAPVVAGRPHGRRCLRLDLLPADRESADLGAGGALEPGEPLCVGRARVGKDRAPVREPEPEAVGTTGALRRPEPEPTVVATAARAAISSAARALTGRAAACGCSFAAASPPRRRRRGRRRRRRPRAGRSRSGSRSPASAAGSRP